MFYVLIKSGIFWTCIGVIITLVVAICVALFPISKEKEVNKENQKKLVILLVVVLAIVLFFFGCYIHYEYSEYLPVSTLTPSSEDANNGDTENENIDNTGNNNYQSTQTLHDVPSSEDESTSSSLPKISIKNHYNSDGLLINGAMGHTEYYKHFFKFNVEKSEFDMFFKDQIDTEFNEVRLFFIDEESNILNHCAVAVGVPASDLEKEYKEACLFNNNDFDNSYTIYFEDGLYCFEVVVNNKTYFSDFVTIDESKSYYINVTQH